VHLQKLGTPKEGRLAARSGHAGETVAASRRPGFSKRQLAAGLDQR
jgi:hypothetical protein